MTRRFACDTIAIRMITRVIQDRPSGRIEVITGGMFLRRALIARQKVKVFKPLLDSRHPPEVLITRDNRELAAESVESARALMERIDDDTEVVGIDEAQFFDDELEAVAMELADRGVRVVIAGLDQDYLRRAFGPMPSLMALAEHVDKMHAVCVRCGSTAHYSQRISGGVEQVEVGDTDIYEARCRSCFVPYDPATGA
jgi:thymidine kinase